jgi:hypothetical protein
VEDELERRKKEDLKNLNTEKPLKQAEERTTWISQEEIDRIIEREDQTITEDEEETEKEPVVEVISDKEHSDEEDNFEMAVEQEEPATQVSEN